VSPREPSDARSRLAGIADRLRRFSQSDRTKCAGSIKAIEGHLMALQADRALIGLLSAAFTAVDMG
jgi:hypothetical protein